MRISYCLLQVLLSVVIAGAALAQDTVREGASLSGYVRDVTSGETLLLANVRVDGTSIGAATNNSGYYTVTGIPPGALTVAVSYIGYRTERVEVELAPGEQRRLDIELLPEEQDIEEVTVTGEREELYEARKIGVQQLQTQLIKSLPAFLQPDVFRSLQLLPGVKAASDYSSGLYIRGGGPDQTLILLDRTSIYNPSHFFGVFSTFNPDAIKDVRLYKGGFPAEYGGRLGSVVDIYNRDGNRREFDAGLSIGLLSSRGIIEGPWRRGSYMLAMRRSTIEPVLYFLRKADIQGIPDAFYFVDVNGKVQFRSLEQGLLFARILCRAGCARHRNRGRRSCEYPVREQVAEHELDPPFFAGALFQLHVHGIEVFQQAGDRAGGHAYRERQHGRRYFRQGRF